MFYHIMIIGIIIDVIIDVAILGAAIVVIKGVFVDIVIHAISVTPPILQYSIRWNSDGNRETLQQYVKMFPHATKVPESVSEDGDAVPKM